MKKILVESRVVLFQITGNFSEFNNSLEQMQLVTSTVSQNQRKHSSAALTGHFIRHNVRKLVRLNS